MNCELHSTLNGAGMLEDHTFQLDKVRHLGVPNVLVLRILASVLDPHLCEQGVRGVSHCKLFLDDAFVTQGARNHVIWNGYVLRPKRSLALRSACSRSSSCPDVIPSATAATQVLYMCKCVLLCSSQPLRLQLQISLPG